MAEIEPQVTLAYYKRLYPFKSVYNWLNHQPTPTRLFTHREFAVTLIGDVYVRYHSFADAEELKKEICRLNPSRFEVGAIYSARPKDKKSVRPNMFTPQLRELVFDIDMTDYDEIRTCCSGKGICKRCWGFIAAAVDVLDQVLRDQFGYKHLLWVFSGRRGIHLWISDQAAMALTDDARRALVSYLEVIKGGVGQEKKVNVRTGSGKKIGGLHPMLLEAFSTLHPQFKELILEDQDCFASTEGWNKLLALIPDEEHIVTPLRQEWETEDEFGEVSTSKAKWKQLRAQIKTIESETEQVLIARALEDVVLQYMYPRIDSEVSKRRNHLLKAPFCVHPATGNICVPIDPAHVHEFDPTNVPTVSQLLQELDDAMPEDGESKQPAWEKTSLKPYIDMMDAHVRGLMKVVQSAKRDAAMKGLDF